MEFHAQTGFAYLWEEEPLLVTYLSARIRTGYGPVMLDVRVAWRVQNSHGGANLVNRCYRYSVILDNPLPLGLGLAVLDYFDGPVQVRANRLTTNVYCGPKWRASATKVATKHCSPDNLGPLFRHLGRRLTNLSKKL